MRRARFDPRSYRVPLLNPKTQIVVTNSQLADENIPYILSRMAEEPSSCPAIENWRADSHVYRYKGSGR
jgi:hypothetical protein